MEPIVSVIIPTYNGRRHIRETLKSVLEQTYRSLEIIVVDDGSTDGTAEEAGATAPRAKIIRQERSGHPAARNRGVRESTGDFLSFLDHDDLWEPAKIETQLRCFEDEPSLDLAFGEIQNFFSPELGEEERKAISVPLYPLPGLLQGAMLAKRKSFLTVGAFNEGRDMGDFLDWYGRALILKLNTHMQSSVVLRRRIHATNFQRTHDHLRPQYLAAVKQLLDRRRLATVGAA